jgi:hypothetical protein
VNNNIDPNIGFKVTTADGLAIRFRYDEDAPMTVKAFTAVLPFTRSFLHARTSGEEIWTGEAPPLDVIQENASVFTLPGEVVYGPSGAKRAHTRNCMGIYYGEGRGLDSCNIFARVYEEDMSLLVALGEAIWRKGEQSVTFSSLT